MAASLEKTGKTVLKCGFLNTVKYNIVKRKAILFCQTQNKRVKDKILVIWLKLGKQKVKFNNKAIQLLGIWLDSWRTFSNHIKKRVK